jgi:hypothetical protein
MTGQAESLSSVACAGAGWYCVGCEAYKDEAEMEGDHACPLHKAPCVQRSEENYFFALSRYQAQLQARPHQPFHPPLPSFGSLQMDDDLRGSCPGNNLECWESDGFPCMQHAQQHAGPHLMAIWTHAALLTGLPCMPPVAWAGAHRGLPLAA